MKFHSLLSPTLLIVLALIASVFAAPLQDLSVTSVDLSEEAAGKGGNEHLYVTVTRTDDLVDDDGSLVAERVMAVRVTFDVVENTLRCNGVPIEIGVSNIQVEAQMAANPNKLTISSEEDVALLEDTFDIGLVTVEVTATLMDELKVDDMTFRRIRVEEVITEVNGQQVVQTEAGQQIIDVFETGVVHKWGIDPVTGALLPGPALVDETEAKEPATMNASEQPARTGCAGALVKWWNEQSQVARGLMTGAFFAGLFGIALAIRQVIISSPKVKYDRLQINETNVVREENKDGKQDETVDVDDEKRPFLS